MANTKTKTAIAVELESPPNRGDISVVSTLEEDAHYLRVTLDKAENFKVAAGEKLRDLLVNKFGNNRNALRDWYEEAVVQGKEHRSWSLVEGYLSTVRKYGEQAAEIFAKREEDKRAYNREYDLKHGRVVSRNARLQNADENANEINATNTQSRPVKSEYDIRKEWLSDMNVLWFKGEREWQDRWLQDRNLSRRRDLG